MKNREHRLKIGVSGIRGVVGDFLTPSLACSFAQSFGTYVGGGRVVVGRDTRSSGPMLVHAVSCGLLASGCEVIEVGVQPTPTIQVYLREAGARGGLAVTASHNPAEYNALKLFNAEGLFFNHYERSELLDLYHQSGFYNAGNAEIQGVVHDYTTPPKLHIERVLKQVDAERIRSRRPGVALGGVNGAGSELSVHFLREVLGCRLDAISVDPTKPFPRVAEPRPDTLAELSALVTAKGADIGFGQDPDGDRLAVIDENGVAIDNDDVLALAVDWWLRRNPGPVVVNLTTSSVIDDVAARFACPVLRTPVGEANVVWQMQASGATIGGEGSNGGIILPAVHPCRDSYSGMALLLERMAETGETVSQMAGSLPAYHRLQGKVSFAHGRLGALMQGLETRFPGAAIDRRDGLKLLFDGSWLHVRASNTEPILRICAEARRPERLAEVYDIAMSLLA